MNEIKNIFTEYDINIDINDDNLINGNITKTLIDIIINTKYINENNEINNELSNLFNHNPISEEEYLTNWQIIDEILSSIDITSEISYIFNFNKKDEVLIEIKSQVKYLLTLWNNVNNTDNDVINNEEFNIINLTKIDENEKIIIPDNINLNKIDLNKPLENSKNLLELIILVIIKNINIEPIYAAALLSNNSNFFNVILVKGYNNDYDKIISLLNDIFFNLNKILFFLINDNNGENSLRIFNLLKSGILSHNSEIVKITLNIYYNLYNGYKLNNLEKICYSLFFDNIFIYNNFFNEVKEESCFELFSKNLLENNIIKNSLIKIILLYSNKNDFLIIKKLSNNFEQKDNQKLLNLFFNKFKINENNLDNIDFNKLIIIIYNNILNILENNNKTIDSILLDLLKYLILNFYSILDSTDKNLNKMFNIFNDILTKDYLIDMLILNFYFILLSEFSRNKFMLAPLLYNNLIIIFLNKDTKKCIKEFIIENFLQIFNNEDIPTKILLKKYLKKLKQEENYHISFNEIKFLVLLFDIQKIDDEEILINYLDIFSKLINKNNCFFPNSIFSKISFLINILYEKYSNNIDKFISIQIKLFCELYKKNYRNTIEKTENHNINANNIKKKIIFTSLLKIVVDNLKNKELIDHIKKELINYNNELKAFYKSIKNKDINNIEEFWIILKKIGNISEMNIETNETSEYYDTPNNDSKKFINKNKDLTKLKKKHIAIKKKKEEKKIIKNLTKQETYNKLFEKMKKDGVKIEDKSYQQFEKFKEKIKEENNQKKNFEKKKTLHLLKKQEEINNILERRKLEMGIFKNNKNFKFLYPFGTIDKDKKFSKHKGLLNIKIQYYDFLEEDDKNILFKYYYKNRKLFNLIFNNYAGKYDNPSNVMDFKFLKQKELSRQEFFHFLKDYNLNNLISFDELTVLFRLIKIEILKDKNNLTHFDSKSLHHLIIQFCFLVFRRGNDNYSYYPSYYILYILIEKLKKVYEDKNLNTMIFHEPFAIAPLADKEIVLFLNEKLKIDEEYHIPESYTKYTESNFELNFLPSKIIKDNTVNTNYIDCYEILIDLFKEKLNINIGFPSIIETKSTKVKAKPLSKIEIKKKDLYQIKKSHKIKYKKVYEKKNISKNHMKEPSVYLKLAAEDYKPNLKPIAYEIAHVLDELFEAAINKDSNYRLYKRDEKKIIMNSILEEKKREEDKLLLMEKLKNKKFEQRKIILSSKIKNKNINFNKSINLKKDTNNDKNIKKEKKREFLEKELIKYKEEQKKKLTEYKKQMEENMKLVKMKEDEKRKKEFYEKKKKFEEFKKKKEDYYTKLFVQIQEKNKLKNQFITTKDKLKEIKKINQNNIENLTKLNLDLKNKNNIKNIMIEKVKKYNLYENLIEEYKEEFKNIFDYFLKVNNTNIESFMSFHIFNKYIIHFKFDKYINKFQVKSIFNKISIDNNNNCINLENIYDIFLEFAYIIDLKNLQIDSTGLILPIKKINKQSNAKTDRKNKKVKKNKEKIEEIDENKEEKVDDENKEEIDENKEEIDENKEEIDENKEENDKKEEKVDEDNKKIDNDKEEINDNNKIEIDNEDINNVEKVENNLGESINFNKSELNGVLTKKEEDLFNIFKILYTISLN